ncbi:monocarboxylate transporter 2 isoform X1 [Procambarus clarkii]|uniref:monocarboxylate transporter 2 isoform X1 n=1 Tax=Procambarus clarkii TaxID=6728 RepID=UPI003744B021
MSCNKTEHGREDGVVVLKCYRQTPYENQLTLPSGSSSPATEASSAPVTPAIPSAHVSTASSAANIPLEASSSATNIPLEASSSATNIPLEASSSATNIPLEASSSATNIPLEASSSATNTPPEVTSSPSNISPELASFSPNISSEVASSSPNTSPCVASSTVKIPPYVASSASNTPPEVVSAVTNIHPYVASFPANTPPEVVSAVTNIHPYVASFPANTPPEVATPPAADDLPPLPRVQDEGYAWLVAGMVFSVNLVTAGYVKSFGILYILVLDYFPDISGAAAGWVVGLLVGCRGLLSPVMGALTVAVGPRVCVLAGTLLAAGGLLLAVPAFSIFYMAFTLGGLVGTGLCMSETPGFLTVTDYFQEKRALANGLRAAGNPMGGILFPPLVVFLHHHFGLRGTFMMLAGIMLQMLVFGLLMRPFELHKTIIYEKYKRQIKKKIQRGDVDNTEATAARLKVLESGSKKKPLDFTVFKNPAYVMYLVMGMFANAAMPNALFYSPVYGKSIGLSPYENSIVASYVSGCDFCIRLLCGWITNMNLFKTRYAFIAGYVNKLACIYIACSCSTTWCVVRYSANNALNKLCNSSRQ